MLIASSKTVLLILALLSAGQTGGPPKDNPDHPAWNPELSKLFNQMGNWDDQAPALTQALENMWAKNGWNTEADRAALDFSRRLTRIPPWDFRGRMNLLTDSVQDRYSLSPEQTDKFQRLVFREAWTMGMKYGPIMVQHGKGLLEARANGQPFTAEQVADLEKALDPHIDGLVDDINHFVDEFEKDLTPDQKRILARDRASLEKRKAHFMEAREGWMRGEWTPDAWGLEDDPIHAEVMRALRRPRVAIDPDLTGTLTYDDSTWHRYVRQFIELYDLDSSQQQSCRAILQDLVTRAQSYLAPRRDLLKGVSRAYRSTAPEYAPVRRMFDELQARLAVIPTAEQVEAARARQPQAFKPTPDRRRPPSMRRPRTEPGRN